MATIIFDFDHTLFDTKELKRDMDKIIEESGIPAEVAKVAEDKFRAENFNNYDFHGHLGSIEEHGKKVHQSVHDRFAELDFKKHIKGDPYKVITSLRAKGHRTILLTRGVEKFQKLKLTRSGLEGLFGEHIIICPTGKEDVLRTLDLDHEDVYIFNDDIGEIERMKTALPHAVMIICKRDDNKFDYLNIDQSFHVIDNINDLESLIK